MNLKNIYELFIYDKDDFIRYAYLSLLHREPDRIGLEYYQGRLSMKHGKNRVIYQLAQSEECRAHDEINGLVDFLSDEEKSNKWYWKLLGIHRYRLSKKIRKNVYLIVKERSNRMIQSESGDNQLISTHHADDSKKIIRNVNHTDLCPDIEKTTYSIIDEFFSKEFSLHINYDDLKNMNNIFNDEIFLRFAYLWLLGRPIDPDAFNVYSRFLKEKNDRLEFIKMIMNSEEFKNYQNSNKIADSDQQNYPFSKNMSLVIDELLNN